MGDRLRNGAHGRQWVDGSEGAGELEGREWVEVTGSWIRFRNYLRRKEVGEDITLLMNGLVLALDKSKYMVSYDMSSKATRVHHTVPFKNVNRSFRSLTQLRLKQSCEQKKLSVPIFRQVGHWSVPASLVQSTPIHFRVATAAILR